MIVSQKLLTRQAMADCDQYTIETLGIPSQTLMERAAHGVVDYMTNHPHIFPIQNHHVVVLCGGGNNGGDGLAVARFLQENKDVRVSVCYIGKRLPDGSPDTSCMSVECAKQYLLLKDTLVPVFAPSHMADILPTAHVVVDAMLGIGLDRPIQGEIESLIHLVNATALPTLAVDIPTGVCADTGNILGCCIKATATVTMQAIKQGMILYPATAYCGDIHVCHIGVDLSMAQNVNIYLADQHILPDIMPQRARRTHKGTYGQVALICGSEGMCGAAILCGMGALRSGVGLIRMVTPDCNATAIHIAIPEVLVTPYRTNTPMETNILNTIKACDGVVIGCGLGKSQTALDFLTMLLDNLPIDEHFPVVLDADALNLLAAHPELWGTRLLRKGCNQVVITPHPMEFARLCDVSVADVLANTLTLASGFAKDRGVVVVLKDAHTVIASPSGEIFLCGAGNAGMAKGGAGDVLSGILGSLLTQNRQKLGEELTLCEVVAGGVALHAMSGDAAADVWGEYAMTPSDIANCIAMVSQKLSNSQTKIDVSTS